MREVRGAVAATAIALCIPNVVATALLWLVSIGGARPIESSAVWLFAVATYGPLLLVGSAILTGKLMRSEGIGSGRVVVASAALTIGIVAALFFHWRLIWDISLP
jgi:hypothetical protein